MVLRNSTDVDICFVYMTGTYCTVLQYNRILGLVYSINVYHVDILANNHTTGKIHGTEKCHFDSNAELETQRKTAQKT